MTQLCKRTSHMLLIGPERMVPVRRGQKNNVGHDYLNRIQHGHLAKTW